MAGFTTSSPTPDPGAVRDPRTALAESARDPRVMFAAERTLLAWIRTGLAMMGFGFVVARFGLFLREIVAARGAVMRHTPGFSLWIGVALVLLGVAVTLLSAREHVRLLRRLEAESGGIGPQSPARWQSPLGVWVAVMLALVGCAMAGYLIALDR
jgi:putative membrane protein